MTAPKLQLDPPVVMALGKVSPELAWEQVQAMVSQALEVYPAQAKDLFKKMDSREDEEELLDLLGNLPPVEGLNQLHYINREMDLRDIPHQPPLKVLEAVLRITCKSDRWASRR